MLYYKDKEYALKYVTTDGDKKELKYTPEKDMSTPQIINMLKEKDSNFFTLLKEENTLVKENKITESYEPLDDDIQMEIYEMIVGGYYSDQTQEENIENTIMEIVEEYPELKDKMEDVRFYVEQKVPDVYEEKDEENEEDLEESKLTEDENTIIDNLYDLLEYRNFELITVEDSKYDMSADYYCHPDDSDPYQTFLVRLAKSLKINPVDIDDIRSMTTVVVNMEDWVIPNFDTMEDLFGVGGADEEDEIKGIIEFSMVALIEGNAGTWAYEELNKQAKFTESIDNGMQDLEAISVLDEDKDVEDDVPYDNTTPKKCPICGKTYTDFPALSRRDNKTYICPDCGVDEAMEDYFKAMSKQESLTESIPITNDDLRDKYDEYITEIDPDTTMSFEEFKQSYIDTVKPDGESFELVESVKELEGTGEDQTQTQEDVEQAVSEVENPTEEDKFAVETANSNIEVLIADEQQAIDGYKAFLTQAKETVLPSLYEVLEKEINEIIADEEDHINKLNTIKSAFHLEDIPLDESKKVESVKNENGLKEESNLKYKKGDIVPYKGKEYKIVKAIPAHYWKGQNASEEDNSFVEFTDDMYEIQNPNNESDWGYVKANQLDETYELTPEEYEHKYNQVFGEMGIDIDSPQEQEDSYIVGTYIKNHPEKTVDEIIEVYRDFLEFGDSTILESKIIK